jgi:flagellar basal-body rod protein FlgC
MTPVAAIALSGLTAATLKLNASASNLANAGDERAVGSAAYSPVGVVNSAAPGGGVTAQAVTLRSPSLVVFNPGSPVANAQGLVETPDISPIAEVSNQLAASHAFVVSLEALKVANDEEKTLLDLKT